MTNDQMMASLVNDEELADLIIGRLNKMIEHPDVRADIGRLLEQRVSCSKATVDHPTLQAVPSLDPLIRLTERPSFLGALGLLNGIVGVQPDGPRRGWGYIAAFFNDDGELMHFGRTEPRKG